MLKTGQSKSRIGLMALLASASLAMVFPAAVRAADTTSCLSLVKTPDNAAALQPKDQTPSAADRAAAKTGNQIDQALGPDKGLTQSEMRTAIPIKSVDDPARALATAEVKSCAGEALGTVKSVDISTDGKPRAIRMSSGGFLGLGEHVVSIDAERFAYLKDRNLLVTDLSKDQIKAMPNMAMNN